MCRLAPGDYHRVHSPVAGRITGLSLLTLVLTRFTFPFLCTEQKRWVAPSSGHHTRLSDPKTMSCTTSERCSIWVATTPPMLPTLAGPLCGRWKCVGTSGNCSRWVNVCFECRALHYHGQPRFERRPYRHVPVRGLGCCCPFPPRQGCTGPGPCLQLSPCRRILSSPWSTDRACSITWKCFICFQIPPKKHLFPN